MRTQQAMFSVGEYELANFQVKGGFNVQKLGSGAYGYVSPNANVQPKPANTPAAPVATTPGVRKSHVRKGKGGVLRNVRAATIKTGQNVIRGGKKFGGMALDQAKLRGGQALGATVTGIGNTGALIAANPKTSAALAGAGVLGAGSAYLLTRPKRKRR